MIMSKINIKMLSEDALVYLKENAESIAKKIAENEDNSWIKNTIPQSIPLFVERNYKLKILIY